MKWALILFAAVVALGQTAPDKARIAGRVVSSTGEPVRNANIRLTTITPQGGGAGLGNYAGLSDDKGNFAIEDITPVAVLALTAQKAGYANTRYGARTVRAAIVTFALKAGESREDFVLTMVQQGVVNGRILDDAGDPVQGAQVTLLRPAFQAKGRQLVPDATASTNDLGEFRLPNLVPGPYYLMARTTKPYTDGMVGLATYFPNTPDAKGARKFEVGAGQELRGMEIRLQKARGYAVRGKVANFSGAVSMTVRVNQEDVAKGLVSAAGVELRVATVRAGGTFEVTGLTPGTYQLQMTTRDTTGQRFLGSVPLVVGNRDVDDVILQAPDPLSVTGTLRVEDGSVADLLPQPGAATNRLAAAGNTGTPTTMRLTFTPLDELSGIGNPNAIVKPDGTFTVNNIGPGRYIIERLTVPGTYVKAVEFGGTDLTRKEIAIGGSGSLNLVIGKDAPDVRGISLNKDGKPEQASMLILWPAEVDASTTGNGVRASSTDINGEFLVASVTPGKYYAVVFGEINPVVTYQRDFITQFQDRAIQVDVTPGSKLYLKPPMIPAEDTQKALEKIP